LPAAVGQPDAAPRVRGNIGENVDAGIGASIDLAAVGRFISLIAIVTRVDVASVRGTVPLACFGTAFPGDVPRGVRGSVSGPFRGGIAPGIAGVSRIARRVSGSIARRTTRRLEAGAVASTAANGQRRYRESEEGQNRQEDERRKTTALVGALVGHGGLSSGIGQFAERLGAGSVVPSWIDCAREAPLLAIRIDRPLITRMLHE
jgi:hypothetical protein